MEDYLIDWGKEGGHLDRYTSVEAESLEEAVAMVRKMGREPKRVMRVAFLTKVERWKIIDEVKAAHSVRQANEETNKENSKQ